MSPNPNNQELTYLIEMHSDAILYENIHFRMHLIADDAVTKYIFFGQFAGFDFTFEILSSSDWLKEKGKRSYQYILEIYYFKKFIFFLRFWLTNENTKTIQIGFY